MSDWELDRKRTIGLARDCFLAACTSGWHPISLSHLCAISLRTIASQAAHEATSSLPRITAFSSLAAIEGHGFRRFRAMYRCAEMCRLQCFRVITQKRSEWLVLRDRMRSVRRGGLLASLKLFEVVGADRHVVVGALQTAGEVCADRSQHSVEVLQAERLIRRPHLLPESRRRHPYAALRTTAVAGALGALRPTRRQRACSKDHARRWIRRLHLRRSKPSVRRCEDLISSAKEMSDVR